MITDNLVISLINKVLILHKIKSREHNLDINN